MHLVIEMPAYIKAADAEGMSENERQAIANAIARDPLAGDVIPGTGGARKIRFAGHGKGKSGGFRVITYYGGDDIPVFLLACYGKGTKSNLTKQEKNKMRAVLIGLPERHRQMVRQQLKILGQSRQKHEKASKA